MLLFLKTRNFLGKMRNTDSGTKILMIPKRHLGTGRTFVPISGGKLPKSLVKYTLATRPKKKLTSQIKLVSCYKNIKRLIISEAVFFGILLCIHISQYKIIFVHQNISLMIAMTHFFASKVI